MLRRLPFVASAFAIILAACISPPKGGDKPSPLDSIAVGETASVVLPDALESLATPQPTTTPVSYGPDSSSFPRLVNPLSGLPVVDPSLLKIPAVLVSISHFPATGRPQSGLSYAPFVYEFSITGGETRFLAAFYGEFPKVEVPVSGLCNVRTGAFVQTSALLGNRVWLDENENGAQDVGEGGVPGICVDLLDHAGRCYSAPQLTQTGYTVSTWIPLCLTHWKSNGPHTLTSHA